MNNEVSGSYINSEIDNNIYNFEFKNIDELYDIFKQDVEKYKKDNISKENLDIEQIFNDNSFESYLKYLDEHTALDTYKNLNIKIYTLYEINLFFYILGYEECFRKARSNTKNKNKIEDRHKKTIIKQSIKDEIDLKKLFNIYYIEDLDYIYKYSISNNKNCTMKIIKCRDLLHPSINKTLSRIFKKKMLKFNSSILIEDENRFRHLFKSKNKEGDINTDCRILIYTKQSEQEINLYQLKIHM